MRVASDSPAVGMSRPVARHRERVVHRPKHERIRRIRTEDDLVEHLEVEANQQARRRYGEWGFLIGAGVVAAVALLLGLLG